MGDILCEKIRGFGLGLREPHHERILAEDIPVDWFEVLSDNFMQSHEGSWDFLKQLRKKYPLILHGIGMNIGSIDPINLDYIQKLKRLAEAINPVYLSDHLCWTGIHGFQSHDLLPVPYTHEALKHIVSRIERVQDMLGRQLVLENPSIYAEFSASAIPEWEFLAEICDKTDCKLLLDVNNVYVSAYNHRYDAKHYINAILAKHIAYIHIAGHKNKGTYIVDTHAEQVADKVWDLYQYAVEKYGDVPTMIEWDSNIPELEVLLAELGKARNIVQKSKKASYE